MSGRSLDPSEAATRERLTRIEVEARWAREIAQDQADDIGRMWERLDLQEMRIERNERSILSLQERYAWILRAQSEARVKIGELLADRDRRQTIVATLKYAAGGLLLALVLSGQITAMQAQIARGVFGLP